ncbi:hypothetical protein JOF57_004042 [Mycolicibacterium lutetiense]|uniref:Uncharacterized protein n=1 Tax=Mycolicibacterium lutetiense TaxID=1641992 RepID=A0ABS4ZX79_9MYCO|nr:hypothetical protein [Mycolicibacterium lutetiense]
MPVDPLFDELANWTDKDNAVMSIDSWLRGSTPDVELVAGNLRLGTVDVRSLQDPAETSALVQQLAKCYVTTPSPLQIPYFDAV